MNKLAVKKNKRILRSILAFLLMTAVVLSMLSVCGSAASSLRSITSVIASVYTDGTYQIPAQNDRTCIRVSGLLPEGAYAKAFPADDTGISGKIYAAYDITVFDMNGNVFQPDAAALNVSISSPEIAAAAEQGRELEVYHIPDGQEPESVDCVVEEKSVFFEAESFSVYLIKDHEIGVYNEPARIEFHFIGDMASKPEFSDASANTYRSPEYQFNNMNNEKQTSLIVADGETIEKIESPQNHGDAEFFFGWYVVNQDKQHPRETVEYDGRSYDCIVYHWMDDPVLVSYNDVISVKMNDSGTALSWAINGVTVQDDLPLDDGQGCCGHIYLAPLYSDYRFVNFFSEPLDGRSPSEIPDETLLARKLIALGANNMSDVLISDTAAPSPDARHKVFVGWESVAYGLLYETRFNVMNCDLEAVTGIYSPSANRMPEKLEDNPNGYFLRCSNPRADVNLYPVFSEARWITFDTNSNKEASYVPSENMLTSESADNPDGTRKTKFEVSRRNGFTFNGWKVDPDQYSALSYDISTGSSTVLSECMLTDGSGTVIAPRAGTTLRVCKRDDPSVVYYEVINDSGTGKMIIYDSVPDGTLRYNYEDGISLTADWSCRSVTDYSVVIWKQQATDLPDLADNEKKYDFYDHIGGLSGETGDTAADLEQALRTYTGREFTGFSYSRTEIISPDGSDRLHADGTSVVNIYYDRKVHELKFYHNAGDRVPVKTIRALYHHRISSEFPISASDGTVYDSGERWNPKGSSTFSQVLVYIDSMPDEDIRFERNTANYSPKTAKYYVEALDGADDTISFNGVNYSKYHEIKASYQYFTYAEDYPEIDGFERLKAYNAGNYYDEFTPGEEMRANIDCYYTRTRWKLVYNCNYSSVRSSDVTFSNGKSSDKTITGIPYETDLGAYDDFTPKSPDLYQFDGWYEDPAGIKKADFSDKMPAGDKTVYAKWVPVQILVKYDLSGGVFTDDVYGSGIYNYYTVTANEPLIKPEPPVRNYIAVSADEAENMRQNGQDVYRYLNYHYISYSDGGDNTNLQTDFRRAQYFADTEANRDELFEQFVQQHPAAQQESIRQAMKTVWLSTAFYGTEEYFRKISDDEEIRYMFDEWYAVDEAAGVISEIPYDFSQPVTKPVTLRAGWRLKGGYRITYIPEYIDFQHNYINSLSETISSWNDPRIGSEDSCYSDHAITDIFRQPSVITKNGVVTNDYTFEGWRLVRRVSQDNGRFKYVPLFPDAEYYEPGERFVIDSLYALEGNNTIYMQAVYEPRSITFRRPETVTLKLDSNGGYLLDSQKNRLSADEEVSWEKPGTALKKHGSPTGYDQLHLLSFQTNKAVHLMNYAVDSKNYETPGNLKPDKVFGHQSDFFLLGFDNAPDEGDFRAAYPADGVVTMNRLTNEATIYAVWEPMVYLDLVNETHEDVTIALSADDSMKLYVINERVSLFDRKKISDASAITIPHKDEQTGEDGVLHIALPCGMEYSPDEPITIRGRNQIGSGCMMMVTSNNPHRTTGDVRSDPEIINYNDSFELSDSLFFSENPREALTVTFTEKKSEYTVILDDNYELGSIHEMYCSFEQFDDPSFFFDFIDPGTRIANEFWGWAYDKDAAEPDFALDSSDYRISDVQGLFRDHHISGNPYVVHLYAVWHPNLTANQVRIYKQVVNGSPDKEFTFRAGFEGKYIYSGYEYNTVLPGAGPADFSIRPDEYLRLTVTKFDGKTNKNENGMTLSKNYPTVDVMVEKFSVSDTDALTPLKFPDNSTEKHLTWSKYVKRGVDYSSGGISFYVTEVDSSAENSPRLVNYDTDIEIQGYSNEHNIMPVTDKSEREVKWLRSDTAAWILFRNERLCHDVTVEKTVVDPHGIAPSKEFSFTVSLPDTNGVTDHNYQLSDKDSSFTLTGGSSHIIRNVPVGAELEITEQADNSYDTSVSCSDDITDLTCSGGSCSFTVTGGENHIGFENTLRSVQLRVRNISEEGNAMTGTVFRMTGKVNVFNNAVPFENGYLRPPSAADNIYRVYYDDDYIITQLVDEPGHSRVPDITVAIGYTGDGENSPEVVITGPEGENFAVVTRDPDAPGDLHSYLITITSPVRNIAPTGHSSDPSPFAVMMLMTASPLAALLIVKRKYERDRKHCPDEEA